MAQVRLNRWEVGAGKLPDVCMRCGADATMERRRNFSWHPQWVYLLIFVGLIPAAIVALILTKRMVVYVPFCEAHKNHWSSRLLLILGTLLFAVVVGIGAMAIIMNMDQRGRNDALGGIACVAILLLIVAWLVVVLVAQNTAIRPTEITDKMIRLTGVSDAFIEALEQEDQDRPSRPRRPRYEDDEDEFNDRDDVRRRRKRVDDYEDEED